MSSMHVQENTMFTCKHTSLGAIEYGPLNIIMAQYSFQLCFGFVTCRICHPCSGSILWSLHKPVEFIWGINNLVQDTRFLLLLAVPYGRWVL